MIWLTERTAPHFLSRDRHLKERPLKNEPLNIARRFRIVQGSVEHCKGQQPARSVRTAEAPSGRPGPDRQQRETAADQSKGHAKGAGSGKDHERAGPATRRPMRSHPRARAENPAARDRNPRTPASAPVCRRRCLRRPSCNENRHRSRLTVCLPECPPAADYRRPTAGLWPGPLWPGPVRRGTDWGRPGRADRCMPMRSGRSAGRHPVSSLRDSNQ